MRSGPAPATHIYAKVHLEKPTLLTTELLTTEDFDAEVHARAPYSQDPAETP